MLRSNRALLKRLQSTTATRAAAVLPTASATATAAAPPPPPATRSPRLKPQPFIPRPASRKLQLESISTTPHDPARSTTLHFLDPTATASGPVSLAVPNLWLRDSSIHPNHVHPSSNQKLFRTTDIPKDGKLIGYGVHQLPGHGDCLVTEWSTPLKTRGMDPKTVKLSVVPLTVLTAALRGGQAQDQVVGKLPESRLWDRDSLQQTLVRTDYNDFINSPAALLESLDGLVRDGIVFVENVPIREKEGHATELKRLVERIGSIRKTWYGDLWDVKAEEGSRNIAYTNLDLGLHMDLTHFDHPPRYQFLHSLLNSQVSGGESYFVDAYALADHLLKTNPHCFSTLCTEPVQFEYKNGPHWTRFARPTFELVEGSNQTLKAVNYSPPFQGNFALERLSRKPTAVTSDDTDRFLELHDALGQFATLCDDPQGRWRFNHQLQPGECVIFDNRRVLHARTAFEFVEPQPGQDSNGERGRWLKGAYMDGDEVWSRWRVEMDKKRQAPPKGRTLFV
ncbi:uncharacterized protein JCM15063_005114 [Sporobolomyces koalae]|uniref:uncharacterized protein n=1 Tax=Sporobolomyces koalae TaxID=500713 RepID=UPI00317A2D90